MLNFLNTDGVEGTVSCVLKYCVRINLFSPPRRIRTFKKSFEILHRMLELCFPCCANSSPQEEDKEQFAVNGLGFGR